MPALAIAAAALFSCKAGPDIIRDNVENAEIQIGALMNASEEGDTIRIPSSFQDGKIVYVPTDDWVSGFFAGTLWYMYELTGDENWADHARKHTEVLDTIQYLTWHHDVGFMIYDSYGNGLRLKNIEGYKDVCVNTAKSLSTRFRPKAGVLQSWNTDRGWQAERGWECPVIIDNMMNLELLFWAARNGGDRRLYDIAVRHAETTMRNQFRKDHTCYHVAVYDTVDGHFIKGVTHQGLTDDSMWARGQAWAIYGYTLAYRETGDPRFLDFARKVSDVYLERLPDDMIPYWDFSAREISSAEPRDASAASITASALLELSTYVADTDSSAFYRSKAVAMLETLSSPAYHAGTANSAFLLHSVGHMNRNWEVDASISYADYYYLEALVRLKRLESGRSVLANL